MALRAAVTEEIQVQVQITLLYEHIRNKAMQQARFAMDRRMDISKKWMSLLYSDP